MVKGLEHLASERRLGEIGLVRGRKVRVDWEEYNQYLLKAREDKRPRR